MANAHTRVVVGKLPAMPADTAGNVLSFSQDYVYQNTVPAGGVGVLVVGPNNYCLGAFQTGALVGSIWTTSAADYVLPPFGLSFMLGVSDVAQKPVKSRCAGVCVSVNNVSKLSNVGGTVAVRRFGDMVTMTPAGSAIDTGFGQIRTSVLSDTVPISAGEIVKAKCVQSLVANSDACTFTETNFSDLNDTNQKVAWNKTYTIGSYSSTDVYPSCEWLPTVFVFDNQSNDQSMALTFVFDYVLQALPAQNSFLSVLESRVPRGLASDYINASSRMRGTVMMDAKGAADRDIKPYLGIMNGRRGKNGALRSDKTPKAKPKNAQQQMQRPRDRGPPRRRPPGYVPPREELRRAGENVLGNFAPGRLAVRLARAGLQLMAARPRRRNALRN